MPASVYRHLVPGLPSTESALSLEHLRPSQLKMLLQSEGLEMEGSREQLLARLKAHLVDTLPTEWVMTALEGDGPHREYATVVSYEGDMYLFGGDCHHRSSSQPGAMNAIMRYNTRMGKWEPVACKGTPPCERSGHSAVVHNGRMWVFGGWKWIVSGASGRMFNDLHIFDFRTKRWSEVEQHGSVPEPRAWHSVWVCGGRMLLYGDNGECEESKAMIGTVLAFDFDTSSWSHIEATGEAPVPESVEGICVRGGRTFALCYSKAGDEDAGMEVFMLDMATTTWSRCPARGRRPSARIGCSTTVVGRDWILHGGFPMHGTGEILSDTFSFDLDTLLWSRIMCHGDAPLPRGGHTAVALGNSVVFLEGSTVHNSGRTRYEVQYCSVIEHLWRRPRPPPGDTVVNCDMLAGVRRLHGDDELADVTLRVGGRSFRAHRAVLAASSDVFDRMFRHDVQETELHEVSISGIEPAVFEALLRYMYCCLDEVPPGVATELFRAADRYAVDGLRTQCLAVLKQGLDVDNIGSFVLLADERGCADLHEACVAYASHPGRVLSVLSSASYLGMMQDNPTLAQRFTQLCMQRALAASSGGGGGIPGIGGVMGGGAGGGAGGCAAGGGGIGGSGSSPGRPGSGGGASSSSGGGGGSSSSGSMDNDNAPGNGNGGGGAGAGAGGAGPSGVYGVGSPYSGSPFARPLGGGPPHAAAAAAAVAAAAQLAALALAEDEAAAAGGPVLPPIGGRGLSLGGDVDDGEDSDQM